MYSLPSQQFQAAPNSAADLFRQLTAAQSPSSPLTSDVFGNNAAGVPASAFFEQKQQPVDVWAQAHGQQTPQQAQQQQQQQTPQQPWSTLIPSRSSTLDVSSTIGTPAISPIGPPQSSRPSSVVPSPVLQKAASRNWCDQSLETHTEAISTFCPRMVECILTLRWRKTPLLCFGMFSLVRLSFSVRQMTPALKTGKARAMAFANSSLQSR